MWNQISGYLLDWTLTHHNRTTVSDAQIAQSAGGEVAQAGFIGFCNVAERDEAIETGDSGN